MVFPASGFPILPWLVASGAPTWVWAALLMAGFVALTVFTMWLARLPARRKPPPFQPPSKLTHEEGREKSDGR
jgi:hypothetical protein